MDRTRRKGEIDELLAEATRLSVEGPLHRAINGLNSVLHAVPGHPTASALLADIYARLGRYEEAISLITRAIEKGSGSTGGVQLKSQLEYLEQTAAALNEVNRDRFDEHFFLGRAVVPDGEGDYFVDTLGFPGLWEVEIMTSREVENGALLRLAKSLAAVLLEVKRREIPTEPRLSDLEIGGEVSVIDDSLKEGIQLQLVPRDERYRLRCQVSHDFLYRGRHHQRETIRKLFKEDRISLSNSVGERKPSSGFVESSPHVLLISPRLASDYGVLVLQDRLRASGLSAVSSSIRNWGILDAYVKYYKELGHQRPDIITVSITDDQIENANTLIGKLRRALPEAFIVIGGPTSQTPEQLACLVPDFDVLIKGDGDEVLPAMCRILGGARRNKGLSRGQVEAIKKLAGGILLKTGNRWICHNIILTNVPASYHLPRPLQKKSLHYWHTSRGCPYDCRFCARWTGRQYRCVTPWERDDPSVPLARRSAQALKEWLLARLVLQFDGELTVGELEERLARCRQRGELLEIPGLREKILIAITDDDFLIDRQRICEFCQEVNRLGLENYFVFSAICSVRSFIRGNEIDEELIEWLKRCNFRYLNLGTDGLSQAVIDQNDKGYSLERHVIPLNKHLKSQGFFVFNNIIFTTPYSLVPDLAESLIMLTVCPFPLNISSETAILGRIGTRFNNEDVLNQRFDWRGEEGQDMGHYFIRDGYQIPKTFKEYALNSNIISYADPVVRDLASVLSAREPSVILEKVLPAEEVGQVIKRWQNLPTTRSELKALASSIAWHQETDGMSLFPALRAIKANMSMMNLSSFVDYRSALTKGKLDRNPSLLWLRERMEKVRALSGKGDMELAEAELRLIIERKPWYARAYAHLISLSMDTGKYAQAISYFTQLQLIEPDLYFYMRFFRALRGYLNIGETFSNEPAIFHVPRYITMSPVFYLIARVKELAGGRNVRKVVFPTVGPQDLDKLYDVLDRLSPNIIDATIAEASFNISKALLSGEVLSFFGIPIMLQEKGKTLLFNYAEIDPQAPMAVVKG